MPFSCFEYVYIIFHVATSLLFVDSILSNRGRKQQLRLRNEVLNYHVHLLPPPIFFILVKIVIASFLFSGFSPRDNSRIACVFVRFSFHSASRMRTKAGTKACCDNNRGGGSNGSRDSIALLATGMWHGACVGQCVSNQTMDWISKAEHVWVVRFIHSSGIPPDLPRPPLAFISLALYLPPFSRLSTVHLIFMSPYIWASEQRTYVVCQDWPPLGRQTREHFFSFFNFENSRSL